MALPVEHASELAASPWTYEITVNVGDRAGNSIGCGDAYDVGDFTEVKEY